MISEENNTSCRNEEDMLKLIAIKMSGYVELRLIDKLDDLLHVIRT